MSAVPIEWIRFLAEIPDPVMIIVAICVFGLVAWGAWSALRNL